MIPGTNLHQFDVWNDGYFVHLPLRYKDGVILNVAAVRMPYEKFAEILEKQAGNYFQGLYFRVPNVELEKGLVRVSNDKEIAYMFDVAELYGRLELYLDHYDMNLSEYLDKAETCVMDESVCKAKGPPKPRYCNEFTEEEMVDWAEMEVEYEASSSQQPRNLAGDVGMSSVEAGDVGRSSAADDVGMSNVAAGDLGMSSAAGSAADDVGMSSAAGSAADDVGIRNKNVDKGKEKVMHDEEETDYDSEVDSEYDSDKSIDYLSPGEEELIELRKRIKARREKEREQEHESLPEMMEVNVDEPVENIGNHRTETFREHDVFMITLMRRLQSSDENGIHDDPFVCVEKHADRYPVYDESTHWRLRHPKVCFHFFEIDI